MTKKTFPVLCWILVSTIVTGFTKVEKAEIGSEVSAYSPFFSFHDGQKSYLVLSNNSDNRKDVAITIYNHEGEAFLAEASVDARSAAEVPLARLLGNSIGKFSQGHVEIGFDGSPYAMAAVLKIVQSTTRVGYVLEFARKSDFTETELSGLLWRPAGNSAQGELVLTNTSDSPLKLEVLQAGRGSGKREADKSAPRGGRWAARSMGIDLGPHAQTSIDLRAVGLRSGTPPEAFTVRHSGQAGDLLAVGLVNDAGNGFSVGSTFVDALPMVVLDAVAPLFGRVEPGGAAFSTVLAAANLENEAVAGKVFLNCSDEVDFEEESFPVNLPPRGSKLMEIKPSAAIAGAVRPNCSLQLELERPATVVARFYSFDATGDFSLELPFKLDGDPGTANGRYPFEIREGAESWAVVQNTSNVDAVFLSGIFYEGGVYVLPAVEVPAHRAAIVDFRRLRDDRTPDAVGNVLPADLEKGQFYWGQDANQRTLAGALVGVDRASGMAYTASCEDCPCWSDLRSEVKQGSTVYGSTSGGNFPVLKGLVKTSTQLTPVKIQVDSCSSGGSTRQVEPTTISWTLYSDPGVASNDGGTINFLAKGTFTLAYKAQHYFYYNSPSQGCSMAGQGQPVASVAGKSQEPTSLQTLSVTTLPTGTSGNYGCTPTQDYGIKVKIKYQVLDQDAEAIASAAMRPQEKVLNAVLNGVGQGNPVPSWTDIGPSRISGTSQFTDALGQFLDAPFGACASFPFTYSFDQSISMLVGGTNYSTRSHHVTVSSSSSGHGSIGNGSDISKSR